MYVNPSLVTATLPIPLRDSVTQDKGLFFVHNVCTRMCVCTHHTIPTHGTQEVLIQ